MDLTGKAKRPTLSDILSNETFVDRYEILEQIGEGATGKVFKVEEKETGKIAALKIIKSKMVTNPSLVLQFRQESDIGFRLQHENIASVREYGLRPSAYVILDYYEGETLSSVLADDKHLGVERSLDIFEQICKGLAHAHFKGVVHCDIKPENILLLKDDKKKDLVKIVNFGISEMKVKGVFRSANLQPETEFYGSPFYTSPEQIRGMPTDPRSDVYSLGCLMYRTLSGKQPIDGDDMVECLKNHMSFVPLKFSEVCPELKIPSKVEEIVRQCMEKNLQNRLQSAQEVLSALRIYKAKKRLGLYSS